MIITTDTRAPRGFRGLGDGPDLVVGSGYSDATVQLQTDLATITKPDGSGTYLTSSDIDGIFGNNTWNALLQFQTDQGLVASGDTTQATWAALAAAVPAGTNAIPPGPSVNQPAATNPVSQAAAAVTSTVKSGISKLGSSMITPAGGIDWVMVASIGGGSLVALILAYHLIKKARKPPQVASS